MTTTKQQKVRIGLFALAAGGLLLLVILLIGGVRFWRESTHYEIVFDTSVYGLEYGADVFLNGVRVGSVVELGVAPDDIRHVRVEIEVDAKAPIRTDTTAVLLYAGITGLKVIDLRSGSATAPKLAEGGRIRVGETLLDRIVHQAESMFGETAQLMARANAVIGSTQRVVDNLAAATDPAQLGALVDETRAAAGNLARASASLRELVDNNRAGLEASLAAVEEAATRTAELVSSRQLRAALADLRQASRTFKEIAREVRQRPSRLLFSQPAPERELP